MVCARVRAIMHSLTLVHYRYVHVHNHGNSKTYPTTMYESILAQMHVFLVVFTNFAFYHDF